MQKFRCPHCNKFVLLPDLPCNGLIRCLFCNREFSPSSEGPPKPSPSTAGEPAAKDPGPSLPTEERTAKASLPESPPPLPSSSPARSDPSAPGSWEAAVARLQEHFSRAESSPLALALSSSAGLVSLPASSSERFRASSSFEIAQISGKISLESMKGLLSRPAVSPSALPDPQALVPSAHSPSLPNKTAEPSPSPGETPLQSVKTSRFSLAEALPLALPNATPTASSTTSAPSSTRSGQSVHCPYCQKECSSRSASPGTFGRCAACRAKFRFPDLQSPLPANAILYAAKPSDYEILGLSTTASPEEMRQKWRLALGQFSWTQEPLAFGQIMAAFYALQPPAHILKWPSLVSGCFFCTPFFALGLSLCPACGHPRTRETAGEQERMKVALDRWARKAPRSRYGSSLEAYRQGQEQHRQGEFTAALGHYGKALENLRGEDAESRQLAYGIGLAQTLIALSQPQRCLFPFELYRLFSGLREMPAQDLEWVQPWPMVPEAVSLGRGRIQLLLAYWYLAIGDSALANLSLQDVPAETGNNPWFSLALGAIHFHTGNHSAALEFLQPLVSRWPDAALLQARCCIFLDRAQEALAILEPLRSRFPETALPFYYLGCSQAQAKNWTSAQEAWQEAGRLSPANPRPQLQLALLQVEQGRPQEALALLETLQAKAGLDAETFLSVGQIYAAAGQREKAVAILQPLAQQNRRVHVLLGSLYEEMGNDAEALSHYRLGLEDSPSRELWLAMGCCHARLRQPDKAYPYLLQAYDAGDRSDAGLAALGYAAITSKGDCKTAVRCWRELHQRYPEDEKILHNLGSVHLAYARHSIEQKKWNQALAELERHIEVVGHDGQVYKIRAQIAFERGLRSLASSWKKSEPPQKAREDFALALQSHPSHPRYLHYLALTTYLCGEVSTALGYAQEASTRSPHLTYQTHYALLLLESGKREEALQSLASIGFHKKMAEPDLRAHLHGYWVRFLCYLQQKNWHEASAILQEVLEYEKPLKQSGINTQWLRLQWVKCILQEGKTADELKKTSRTVGGARSEVGAQFLQGILYAQEGKIQEAYTLLAKVAQTEEGSEALAFLEAFCLSRVAQKVQAGQIPEALALLQKVAPHFSHPPIPNWLASLSQALPTALLRQGKGAEALRLFEEAYRQNQAPRLYHAMAVLTHREAIAQEEAENFSRADPLWKKAFSCWLELVKWDAFWQEEEQRLQKVAKKFDPEEWKTLREGWLSTVVISPIAEFAALHIKAKQSERPPQLLALLEPVLNYQCEHHPDDEEVQGLRLKILREGINAAFEGKDWNKAKSLLEKARQIFPELYALRHEHSLVLTILAQEDLQKATEGSLSEYRIRDVFTRGEKALEIDPYNELAYKVLGNVCFQWSICKANGREYQESARFLAESVGYNPANLDEVIAVAKLIGERQQQWSFPIDVLNLLQNPPRRVKEIIEARGKAQQTEQSLKLWELIQQPCRVLADVEKAVELWQAFQEAWHRYEGRAAMTIYDEMCRLRSRVAQIPKEAVLKLIGEFLQGNLTLTKK